MLYLPLDLQGLLEAMVLIALLLKNACSLSNIPAYLHKEHTRLKLPSIHMQRPLTHTQCASLLKPQSPPSLQELLVFSGEAHCPASC